MVGLSRDYACSYKPPVIIVWDSIPTGLEFWPTFNYAIGIPPKKLIDINSGCNQLIRPELRFKNKQKEIIASIIPEFTVGIQFITKKLPSEKLLLANVDYVHGLFAMEFQNRSNIPLSHFVPEFPSKIVLRAILQSMKKSGWM